MKIQITRGIQLPAFDVEMLNLGKLIIVPFKQYLPQGEPLWLYPSPQIPSNLEPEDYYKHEYLAASEKAISRCKSFPLTINTWGVCDFHWQIYSNKKYLLPQIAQSTIWKLDALEEIFSQNQVLKLLFLRVYCLTKPCIINEQKQNGLFFWFSSEDELKPATDQDLPVVSKASFNQRKDFLMAGEPYPYHVLEALQNQLEDTDIRSETKLLNYSIKQVLGWVNKDNLTAEQPAWIDTIVTLGDRSIAEDEGKSNYKAGTDFEIVIRQSLEFLGFKVDYSHKGGAGGLDLFCSEPYTLVGECKSGKKIPNETAVQLLNLGTIHLADKEMFSRAVKLIIGPGELTDQLKKAAKVHGMAIINPATLEKLVKLHHRYPIDLLKLKDFLVDGQADDEVERYIAQTWIAIKLRSYIVNIVKSYLDNANSEDADISELHAVYVVSNPPQPLKREEMHEILVELSSPLSSYLGRRKDRNGCDRFYYLRDLIVE